MPVFGRALMAFLESDEQMALLAHPPFNRCGWVDGGCGVLARALEAWSEGQGERIALAGASSGSLLAYIQAQHEALRWREWYIDGDGASRKRTWMARWSRLVVDPVIVVPGEVPSEIREDAVVVEELAQRLRRSFGRWPPL